MAQQQFSAEFLNFLRERTLEYAQARAPAAFGRNAPDILLSPAEKLQAMQDELVRVEATTLEEADAYVAQLKQEAKDKWLKMQSLHTEFQEFKKNSEAYWVSQGISGYPYIDHEIEAHFEIYMPSARIKAQAADKDSPYRDGAEWKESKIDLLNEEIGAATYFVNVLKAIDTLKHGAPVLAPAG